MEFCVGRPRSPPAAAWRFRYGGIARSPRPGLSRLRPNERSPDSRRRRTASRKASATVARTRPDTSLFSGFRHVARRRLSRRDDAIEERRRRIYPISEGFRREHAGREPNRLREDPGTPSRSGPSASARHGRPSGRDGPEKVPDGARQRHRRQTIGSRCSFSKVSRRCACRAGSFRASPRCAASSSRSKPGPSVATSNRTPPGVMK